MKDLDSLESIPNARMGQIVCMLGALDILGHESDRAGIAYAMGVKKKSATSSILAAERLGLVQVNDECVTVTELGARFLEADDSQRKEIIGQRLSELEPFATLVRALSRGPLAKEIIMKYVKAKMPAARTWKQSTEAEILRVIRNWCEFGNLMTYDSDTGTYSKT